MGSDANVVVRELEADDDDAWEELARRLASVDADCFPSTSHRTGWNALATTPRLRRATKTFIARDGGGDVDGDVVGFLTMTTGSMECVVTKVAVTSSRRREGVGRELVSAAIARAKDKRARVVRLRVEIDNAAATTLYEALGFEKETERGILSDFYGAGRHAAQFALKLHEDFK